MIARILGVLGGLAAVCSLIFVKENSPYKTVVVAIWAVVPPLWFMIENSFLRPVFFTKVRSDGKMVKVTIDDNKPEDQKMGFDQFKHAQDLARNLWVGIGALLLLLPNK